MNLYGFVGNNGLNGIDRLGLMDEDAWTTWGRESGANLAHEQELRNHKLKESISSQFGDFLARINRSPILSSREVNLPKAIERLKLAFDASRVIQYHSNKWLPGVIWLEDDYFSTAVHESVHAFNGGVKPSISRWQNEGMAEGMEAIVAWAGRIMHLEEISRKEGTPWTCSDIVCGRRRECRMKRAV